MVTKCIIGTSIIALWVLSSAALIIGIIYRNIVSISMPALAIGTLSIYINAFITFNTANFYLNEERQRRVEQTDNQENTL